MAARCAPWPYFPERRHVFHLFVVEAPDRDALAVHLDAHEIATLVHYPSPVHGHPPYHRLGDGPVPLPVAERLSAHILSLPLYPELRDDEIDHVAAALRAFG